LHALENNHISFLGGRMRYQLKKQAGWAAGALALAVGAVPAMAANLLINGGFENPADTSGSSTDTTATGWNYFGNVERASFHNNTAGGKWSTWFEAWQAPGGVNQTYAGPVTDGTSYTLTTQMLFEPNFINTGAIINLSMIWENSGGGTVGTAAVSTINAATSTLPADGTTWTPVVTTGVAPAGAAQIVVEYDLISNTTNAGGAQSAFADDADLEGAGTPPPNQWASTSSGQWQTGTNWSNGTANLGIGADAELLGVPTANLNVYTDVPLTVGTIHFNNAHTYVLDGAGSLTLQVAAGNATVQVDQGSQEINLPTTLASNTTFSVNAGATLVIGNPLTINSGVTLTPAGTGTITYNSIVNVLGGAAISFTNSTHANALNISATGKASLAGGSTSVIEVDNLSNAGTIDVENSEMLINYGSGADPFTTVKSQLASGYNGGHWNGVGINSSHAAASGGKYGVGLADGKDGIVAGLPSGQVEVKFALYGDLNLDGVVNGTDFGLLAANFGKSITGGWDRGDLNYDGTVNGTDFGLLAANFGKSASGSAVVLPASQWAALDAFAAANGLNSYVPEPGSIGLLTVIVAGALGRRRRA
jgi:hypothetical protein